MKLTGVLIAIPAYGQQIYGTAVQSVYNAGQWMAANHIPNSLCWMAAADIVELRNIFLTTWYDQWPADTFSHLLMVRAALRFTHTLNPNMLAHDRHLTGRV